jgi:hypothetical protein
MLKILELIKQYIIELLGFALVFLILFVLVKAL